MSTALASTICAVLALRLGRRFTLAAEAVEGGAALSLDDLAEAVASDLAEIQALTVEALEEDEAEAEHVLGAIHPAFAAVVLG